jgi:integrase
MARQRLTVTYEDALLFEAAEGGPLRYSNWRQRVWSPATRAAGRPEAGFHDLRRVAATALVLEGVDVRTAQSRLGHSDPRMTLGLYAQVVQAADRDAADAVATRFFDSATRDRRAMELHEEKDKAAHPA